MSGPAQNTDRELWRERLDDYYADSLHVTAAGGVGINCGGTVIVKPLHEWHSLAERVRELEAEHTASGNVIRSQQRTASEMSARIAALEEENRRLRIALGEERYDWIDAFAAPGEDRAATVARHSAQIERFVKAALESGGH